MILTSTIKNTPVGLFGFETFGAQIFGTQMNCVPLIVNAIPGDVVAILEQSKRRPQEIGVAVTIDGVDVTGNCTYFKAQKLDGTPGSALIKMAGCAAPASGDTVAIDYRLTENGADYLGEIFRGVVDGKPIVTKEPGAMATINVICRDASTLSVLQTQPVTPAWTGTAHDLAMIELAAAGVVGVLEFDDFDIYNGGGGPLFKPASYFLSVEKLLLWMCSQTSYGNIYADASGAVHVASMSSSRAVDHTYPVNGVSSITDSQAPALLSPAQYSIKPTEWYMLAIGNIGRPWPVEGVDGTLAEVTAKMADHQAVTAALSAFFASLSSATYHDVKVSLNPSVVVGHKFTATDETGTTITGFVRSVEHEGQWPSGFTTTAQISVLP